MTCYFRHLGFVFEKAGITVTTENRKELDCVLRGMVGGDDCPLFGAKSRSDSLKTKLGLCRN